MWKRTLFLPVAVAVVLMACDGGSTIELSIDLRTDYVAGIEFAGVRLTVDGDQTEETLTGSASFVEGRRLFDLDGLEPAARRGLRVELLSATGRIVTSREIAVRHEEDMAVTVVITRDCSAVVCEADQSCLAGRCVDLGCADGSGELCDEPDCTSGSDCPAMATCSQASCQEGLCLYEVVECDEGLYCAPENGCVPIPIEEEEEDMGPPMTDMGVPADMSSPVDMGPTLLPFPDCPFVREGTFEAPSAAPPAYLGAILDRSFGTRIIRATDRNDQLVVGLPGEQRWGDPTRHPGHTRHAWNADESLLFVESGRSGFVLRADLRPSIASVFDTNTSDSVWHPRQATTRIVARDDTLLAWDVRTGESSTIAVFPDYRNLAIGSGRGRMDDAGETIVLDGLDNVGVPVVFAFDLRARVKLPDIKAEPPSGYRWSTISPSGEYVVVVWETIVQVFDRMGRAVGEPWTRERPQGFDMLLDGTGRDLAIGLTTSDFPDGGAGFLMRRALEGGSAELVSTERIAAPNGTVSARATALRDWVFISLPDDSDSDYRGEVIAVGYRAGDVRRLAHTHDDMLRAIGGTGASPTRDGRRIAFTSDWDGRTGVFVIDTDPVCEL